MDWAVFPPWNDYLWAVICFPSLPHLHQQHLCLHSMALFTVMLICTIMLLNQGAQFVRKSLDESMCPITPKHLASENRGMV